MSKAGIWTTVWVTVVCVAGGARLIGTTSHVEAGTEADLIAKAHQLGVPIDPSAIQTPSIPPGQNASDIYQKVADLMEVDKKIQDPLRLVSLRDPVDNPARADIQDDEKLRAIGDAAVPQLQAIFQLADQLESRPKCYLGPETEALNQTRASLASVARSLAMDLCIKADLQDRQGDWTDAMKTLRLANRVSVDAGSRGNLMGMFTQASTWSLVRREYEVLAQRHSQNVALLNELAAQFQIEAPHPDLRKYLVTSIVDTRNELPEIKSFKDLKQAFATNDTPDDVLTDGLMPAPRLQAEVDSRLLASWIDLWPRLPKDATDWRGFQRVLKQANDRVQTDASTLNSYNQMEVSQLLGVVARVGEMETNDQLFLDSLKLLKTRAQGGTLPVLLPETLGKDRIDPFDGEAFRYRRLGTGFVLYSVGKDGVDNGGRSHQIADQPDSGTDIVESFQ